MSTQSHRLIIMQIKSLSNLIKRRIDKIISSGKDDIITGMQGVIIGYLCSHDDCDVFQRDIEDEFKIRRSTATGILNLMEKNGLIERKLVSCDARLKKLVVTQKAVDMHNIFLNGINDIEKNAKIGLSEDEITNFLITLNKIRKNIE